MTQQVGIEARYESNVNQAARADQAAINALEKEAKALAAPLDKAGRQARKNEQSFKRAATAQTNFAKATGLSLSEARKLQKELGLTATRANEAARRLKQLTQANATLAQKQSILRKEFRLTSDRVAKLDRALAGTSKTASTFRSRMNALISGLSAAGVLLAAQAFRQLGTAITGAADASAEYGRVLGALRSQLSARDIGLSLEELQEFASGLGEATLTSEEAVLRAARNLTSFGSISGEVFTRAITLAQDLAEITGGDLEGNVARLAKVLEAPTKNFGALSRAGVVFDDTTKGIITRLVEQGDLLEAQTVVLDEIERLYGGAGAAAAQGYAGALDTLGEVLNSST